MPSIMPILKDRKHYGELFADDAIWEAPIRHLANLHRLAGAPQRGVRGSHIVYRIGDVWIKIMAPMFAQDMAFEVAGLKTVAGCLSVEVPQILNQGIVEDWPYIILSHVDGERIGDVWSRYSLAEKCSLARQIATATSEMQACVANPVVRERGDWREFIAARLDNAFIHHRTKNLDPSWLQQLPGFLRRFDKSEFIGTKDVFLHADLTWDHFLVANRNGAPVVSGVIDFADCRIGHSEYDIPATAAFIFKGEAQSLRAYLRELGYTEQDLNLRLSEKLLAWTCLHFYSDLKNYFKTEMARLPPGDFSALAQVAFPLQERMI